MAGIAVLIATGSCIEPRPMVVAAIARPAPTAPTAPEAPPGNFLLRGSLSQGGMAIGTVPAGTVALTLDGMAVPIAPDGMFLIGFDRDAGPAATLDATRRDGTIVSGALTIAPRAWTISRLATLPKYPVPPADFDRLRPGEIAQINAARRVESGSTGWRQPLLWPATGRISTLFGSQRIYRNGEAGSYHSGIDVAVPAGTAVLAPADGVVILASDHPFLLEGNLLMIDHGMGLNSALMHLSRIVVTTGQAVRRGQVVAYSGATGRVTGAHLHWSLRWRGAKIDPLLVAGPMPGANRQ
ncbi:M23 family metallopeptidase [Sphingomonas bacterium]|uniref:M23 family metallopeptidase n=1 Tax=Sphingomonas bacterium TaxID=1895847 RepID=UPI00262CBF35|nr:M23 family metallopeptidase [Sphingomonas bacterium]